MRRPRIYISSPLTSSGNVPENMQRAMAAANTLIAEGLAPMVPHFNYQLDPAGQIPHDVWMEVETPWVEVAEAVLRLPGKSKGADIEVRHAKAAGVPVFSTINELLRRSQTV